MRNRRRDLLGEKGSNVRMVEIVKKWGSIPIAFALLVLMRVLLPLPFTIEVLIFAIYAMGLNFLLGRAGFISFGQPAYLCTGAYVTAVYLFYFGHNPYLGFLIGILGGLILTVILGPFFVRLRSDYFALVNLAFAVIVFFMLEKVLVKWTHGDNGLWYMMRISSTPILDLGKSGDFFIFTLIVTLLVWIFFKYLDGTVFGAGCLATKVNEEKLKFLGYSTFQIRWLSFVIANTISALAGSLYAVYFGFVSPGLTEPSRVADVVVVTLLGGVGTLYGPLVGAFAYTGMKDLISKFITHWELIVGLLLVTIMLAGEKGIWGTLEPVLKRIFSRNTDKAGQP
jgi:branched-chain amino acid transport system permease protein